MLTRDPDLEDEPPHDETNPQVASTAVKAANRSLIEQRLAHARGEGPAPKPTPQGAEVVDLQARLSVREASGAPRGTRTRHRGSPQRR